MLGCSSKSQTDALHHSGNTCLFALVPPTVATLVDRLLRGDLLFRLFEFLAFLDPGVAYALSTVRSQPLVLQDRTSECTGTIYTLIDIRPGMEM